MNGDISIDLRGLLPYVEDRLLSLFGKDPESKEWERKLKDLARISTEQASSVQTVGMHTPVPIQKIYQPARLTKKAASLHESLSVDDLVRRGEDAVIFAGPGFGKTTLLHHLYVSLVNRQQSVPVLFTLRWGNAPMDLVEFVRQLSERGSRKHKIVVLVDGYDEISYDQQHMVSQALLRFKSLKIGQFLLTCRTMYSVFDINAGQYDLARFSKQDAVQFVEAFCDIYDVRLNASEMIEDLEQRGFADFISHPLMLTLVCILRTGPNPEIPKRAIGLIRRAIETLTFRWDEAKGVKRPSNLPLDGEERIRCLMRIAFGMRALQARNYEIEDLVRQHLKLIQLSKIDPVRLLEELTRWYGMLVPVDESWQFVHRTIHDYLAARYWVETGIFASSPIAEWNIRAAYAVCLLPDATDMIIRMLNESPDMISFSECLYNRAPFDSDSVARAVIARARSDGEAKLARAADGLVISAGEDFYSVASPDFLRTLVKVGSAIEDHDVGTVVACYALAELHRREVKASRFLLNGRLGKLYRDWPFANIDVHRRSKFPLGEVIGGTTI